MVLTWALPSRKLYNGSLSHEISLLKPRRSLNFRTTFSDRQYNLSLSHDPSTSSAQASLPFPLTMRTCTHAKRLGFHLNLGKIYNTWERTGVSMVWHGLATPSRVPLAAVLFGHVSKCAVQDGLHGKAWGEWNP